MQYGQTESSKQFSNPTNPRTPSPSNDHGSQLRQQSDLAHLRRAGSSSASPHSVADSHHGSLDGVSAVQLDERLRRLSLQSGRSEGRRSVAGQRVIDYENALTPSTPRQALGFKVIKRSDPQSGGAQLIDFPNEILTHILSHLHPDSHAAVALVSKRLYALVTTHHAWRMAFLRYFPGHDSLATKAEKGRLGPWDQETSDLVRSETRYFARLTPLATWRSEYLLRTRLLRGLARGKPGSKSGGIGSSTRNSKKVSAVLTYNSKLPWTVTNIHAVFSNGAKKPPKAIHGAADLGVATISDPTLGKVEKWGFDDPFSAAQLDEAFPNLESYGLGDGPAACPNVMDVSQPYGVVAGEGFPGGRAYFRLGNELRGRYLGHDTGVIDTYPDIPKIPELSEAISCVWIAKSSAIPAMTQSMVGILTGSTLGVVTSYALGWDPSGPRFSNGDMTARWVLSPGVPIVCIKVDDNYNQKRKASGRVWAVALNALGEVFYLTETPSSTLNRAKGEDVTKNAWYAGRSVYWQLLEHTRRQARPDEWDKNATRGAYSPRSPADAMKLGKEQLVAEAREIEKFLRHKPVHFRKVCDGWDMRRRLEVDFASDDGEGAGEAVFVIECGCEKGQGPRVLRYMRSTTSQTQAISEEITELPATSENTIPSRSIFGSDSKLNGMPARRKAHGKAPPSPESPTRLPLKADGEFDDWQVASLCLKEHGNTELTASAMDTSLQAVLTLTEDPLQTSTQPTPTFLPSMTAEDASEIPGRRSRLLAVGTKGGAVLLWNTREALSPTEIAPLRIIQTESPEISCVALTALYVVHGGSDGLVQAWDPLASTLEPIRTLNSRSAGRVPRHMMAMNATLRNDQYCAARAIFLDSDPTVLRGVVSFGAFLRYWAYSSTQPPGRKRRLRHSDIHGRLASRRQGGTVSDYISAETAELRLEQEHQLQEQARLRRRFGVGAFGDLTEEEAIRYAQMISEEAFLLDEQRRTSTSDTGSAADASMDTASSYSESTVETVTPEPSVTGASPPSVVPEEESEYEVQIQQAIRLSLLEGVNDHGQSPRGNSSGDYEFPIQFKAKSGKKGKQSASRSPSPSHTPMGVLLAGSSIHYPPEDDDLALALRLSLEEQGNVSSGRDRVGLGIQENEFPPLEHKGKGKGKGKM